MLAPPAERRIDRVAIGALAGGHLAVVPLLMVPLALSLPDTRPDRGRR
jgi:hypothetical protein